MCNDFFTYLVDENKILHVWDERTIPVIKESGRAYAVYEEDRLALKIDICSPDVYKQKDVYENGVSEDLIEKRGIMFPEKSCLYSSLKEILTGALGFFYPGKQDFKISGVVVAQSGGQFLNIYGGLLDDSVPTVEENAETKRETANG